MIVSLGEALIDRVQDPQSATDQIRVGGSPFNVAIALSRLGLKAGLLCPISQDPYGQLLAEALEENGVLRCVEERVTAPTAVAEVSTDSKGHPSYRFFRGETADRDVQQNPPKQSLPINIKALHFGSLVLAQEADWPLWREAINTARSRGAFIAFDPNLRVPLIDDMDHYRLRLEEALSFADLIKASDEDLALLYPGCVPASEIQKWRDGERTIVLTEGSRGAQIWLQNGSHIQCPPNHTGPIVDTVGAGDTFQAALLVWLYEHRLLGAPLNETQARQMMAFANAAARLNCERPGCQPPMREELTPRL